MGPEKEVLLESNHISISLNGHQELKHHHNHHHHHSTLNSVNSSHDDDLTPENEDDDEDYADQHRINLKHCYINGNIKSSDPSSSSSSLLVFEKFKQFDQSRIINKHDGDPNHQNHQHQNGTFLLNGVKRIATAMAADINRLDQDPDPVDDRFHHSSGSHHQLCPPPSPIKPLLLNGFHKKIPNSSDPNGANNNDDDQEEEEKTSIETAIINNHLSGLNGSRCDQFGSSGSNNSHYDREDLDRIKQKNGSCIMMMTKQRMVMNGNYHHTERISHIGHNGHPVQMVAVANGVVVKTRSNKSKLQSSTTTTPDSKYNRYEKAPNHIAFLCYISYAVLIIFGYLRDFMRKCRLEKNLAAVERDREGFTSLYKSFESFYTRNIYRRICDAWNRPIASVPGAEIDLVDRRSLDHNWSFEYPGTKTRVINMGSYNYLGYAENTGQIHGKIVRMIQSNGVGICSTRNELGHGEHVEHLERLMARFLGVPACVVFGMGFATNSTNIQCFVHSGCLILSDEHNHASLILGCRLSGATTRVFKHNDMKDLERKIRKYLVNGQPKSGEPWNKIFILVEGIYSMEGTIVNLPELIRLKKKYKCYIYLDEAHSIGALGPNARGVIDYYGCDPNDVDILMGTFTKSFGAAGGYLAGSQSLVDMIRIHSYSHYYANPMSAPIAKQIICVVQSLLGEDGTDEGAKRIKRLAHNSRYFRKKLRQMGFIVYGHDDSPVVPLLICFCSKIAAVIRMAHDKGLGFIGAGFPATPLTTGRVRFCVSAAHTKQMLDRSLEVINEIGDKIEIKYSQQAYTPNPDDDNEEEEEEQQEADGGW